MATADILRAGIRRARPDTDSQSASRPDRRETIAAIIAELGCSQDDAIEVCAWTELMVNRARENANIVHPNDEDMATVGYQLFDRLFPHHAKTPEPGSAADVLTRHVLDPANGEFTISHYQTGPEARDCTVEVHVNRVGT